MNRIFRIVWSQAQRAWVVVSELATRRGKGATRTAVSLFVLCLPAQAADRYWDANGTVAGFGGSGTWDTTGLFWSPNGDGVSGPYDVWNNAALDNAIFGGTAGTVTLGAPITVHNLTFLVPDYVLTGNTLTLAGVTPTIDIGSGTATIGSSVAGTAGLTKSGDGTLILSGNNTFSGGTTISAGTLRLGSSTAMGAIGRVNLSPGTATLDLNGFNTTIGPLHGTGGTILLGSGQLTINASNCVGVACGSYAGTISGTGGVTVLGGGGGQQLSGCGNTYTGATVINTATTLSVNCLANGGLASSIGASGSASGSLVLAGGTLAYTGGTVSIDRGLQMTSGGGINVSNSGTTLEFSGQVTGIGIFNKSGPGTLLFSGNNTYTGQTNVSQGTFRVGSTTAISGPLNVSSGATFDLNGFNAAIVSLGGVTGSTVALNGGTLTTTGGNYLGVITGAGGLVKNGTGTQSLRSCDSSYTGSNVVNGGTLHVICLRDGGVNSSIGASSAAAGNLVFNNGALLYAGTGDSSNRQLTIGTATLSASGTGALNLTSTAPLTLTGTDTARTFTLSGTNTGNNTLAALIGDNGTGATSLTKSGTGTWVLTGNNTYSGNTLINAGNLVLGNGGTSGSVGTGNVILASATSRLTINRSDIVALSGALSGTGTLAQVGTGVSTLTAANNSVGATTISAGTLDVDGGLTTPTIAMTGTSALNVDGTVEAAGAGTTLLTGDVGNSTIDVNAGAILRANGNLGGGSDALTVSGTLDTGAATLNLGSTSNDTLTLFDGAVLIGAGVEGGSDVLDTVVVNNALAYTLSGTQVTGFEALVKQNSGVLTLADTHAFSVGSTVEDGTLAVTGTLTTPILSLAGDSALVVDGTVENTGGTVATIVGGIDDNVVVVNGTLRANGSMGSGNDTFTLSGALDTGAGVLDLADGDDTFTLRDGASIAGVGVSGGATTNDLLVLDNALDLAFDASQTTNFEALLKQNTGTATLGGTQAFDAGATITGGTLEIDGALTLPTVAMGDDTALVVDGSLQGAGATTVAIAGSTGANTVVVNGTALANGALGDGDDVLDVAGTLDTGAGAFDLGDGNDTLTIHDGTNIVGTVIAGAGIDIFDTNIATVADLGAVQGFETLRKTGAGALDINGPASSDFLNVEVLAGTLNVTAGGSVTAAPGNTLDTLVASGATLHVDGSYGCGADDDTMDVAGTVNGTGTIDLCGGDDVLTLRDGAVLANGIDGGTENAADTLVLDSANALAFDVSNTTNFEFLRKTNVGTATMTDVGIFLAGTAIDGGVLDVDGVLLTPTVALADDATLQVDGALDAGGVPTLITGSTGSNTLSIGAGGTAFATGDLGAGDDVLDVAGTLDINGGTFFLGAGDDAFVVHDGTTVLGTVDGGDGLDTRVYEINTVADVGALVNFEGLTKTGVGVLNLTGPGATDLQVVEVLGGTLAVGPLSSIVDVEEATVASGATLALDGDFTFTAGADTFRVAGTVSGPGTIDMLDGDDLLVLQDGAQFAGLANAVDGGLGTDTLLADIAGSATLNGVVDFEVLTKTNVGTLNVDGPVSSDFDTVNVLGGVLDVGIAGRIDDVVTTTVATGATLHVDGDFAGTLGDDTMTVAGTVSGTGMIELDAGDDTLTLTDGAVLANVVYGGAHTVGDTVQLDNAGALTFDGGNTVEFEFLQKDNAGTATMTGTGTFATAAIVTGGVLDIDGALATPLVVLDTGTTLHIDGSLDGGAGTTAVILGSTGANTVSVGTGGTALAVGDLGDGDDVLDVAGTLDIDGGTFALGAGDDTFVVHDGTLVLGTIDGGDGADTRAYDINGTADLGALVNFEGLSKTGIGTLHINGPAASGLEAVEVLGGTLHVAAGASVEAVAGGVLGTTVASGATLQVDGTFGCGDANDTLDVAGTVSGTGTIDLCGGDDVLTLRDGAALLNTIDGGVHGAGDTVVLDSAVAMTFDTSHTTNFEALRKDNIGTATLSGAATFVAGTVIAGGTLDVQGTLTTPTVALQDDTTLHVDGLLQAGASTPTTLTGTTGTNTVSVGADGLLFASGDLGDGQDVLDVAGVLDTGAGVLALGAGDDLFTIHDDTDVVGVIEAGDGTDTFNANIAGHAELGAVQDFETLRKSGGGVLDVEGPLPSDFDSVDVVGGTLHVASGGSVAAMHTTVAAGATLDVQGAFTGTAGDDTFLAHGTVVGSLAFGAGDDDVAFVDADIRDLVALDGGDGANDRLSFDGMLINDADLPLLSGWEQGALLAGSELRLGGAMVLGNLSDPESSVLVIDPTSRLVVTGGAQVLASVANAGTIDLGAHRLAIGGDYVGNDGLLDIAVSPANVTSGGLDIAGDVTGTTRVAFHGDGTEASESTSSILVIDSPNDDLASPAAFATDGVVRLSGSALPWTLAQAQDHNWYLNAGQDALLPEIGGYAILPSIGRTAVLEHNRLLFQRMSATREDTPRCGTEPEGERRAYWQLSGDCTGAWMAASASEIEMGADPGFAFSGDSVGLFLGADVLLQDRDTRTLRGGVFLGFQRGNHWTTGANSTTRQGIAESNVRTDTPVVGLYQGIAWRTGTYLDMSLVADRPEATIVADGFRETVTGNSLTLAARIGHQFALDNGWHLDPHLQLDAVDMHWGGDAKADGAGVAIADDGFASARAALRAGRTFEMAGGAQVRPWATLGVQDTFDARRDAIAMPSGLDAQAAWFPSHAPGLAATLDVGVEAELNAAVSLFGVVSLDQGLDGTDVEQRQANLGVRVRW